MDKLLKAEDVAGLLNVSRATPYVWVHRRCIPFVKLGRSLRFKLSDVEALVIAGTRPASGEGKIDHPDERG